MTQKPLLPLLFESASKCLADPRFTPGETIGSVIGSPLGPYGAFVGGTLGRAAETRLSEWILKDI